MEHDLPDKLYFRIGEASKIVGVPAYVLRFWEGQFPTLKPVRTEKGQRLYRRKDILLLLSIKNLLHDKQFTIKGARRHLRGKSRSDMGKDSWQIIERIRNELEDLRKLLD